MEIRVQGVTQLRSGRLDQDTGKDRLLTPTSLYRWREGFSCLKCEQSPSSAAFECRCRRMLLQRGHCKAGATSTSATRSETADCAPVCRTWRIPPLWWEVYPDGATPVLRLRWQPHGELPRLYLVERGEDGPCKANARGCPKERRHGPLRRSESSASPALCRADGPR